MLRGQPPLPSVLDDFSRFVGNSPVLGHNVRFDLSFLRKQKILALNDPIDSYDLAAVLLPNAGRYSLSALAQGLGIPVPEKHRGMSDAHTTWLVFLRLVEEMMAMPISLLAEIVRLCEPLEWGGAWAFQQVLRQRSREIVSTAQTRHAYRGPIFSEKPSRSLIPLQPREHPVPIDPEEVAALLEHGGVFSQHFPQFEYRPQQVEMLRAVTQALCEGHHLLVEAGTGTGKSMAYLIPAALYAVQNNARVVISTNTINLQDQLINKDIPDLRAALGIDLRAVVIKGRANYLCPRRLESVRRRGPTGDARPGQVLVWLEGTQTGDKAELNLNGPIERDVWSKMSAEDEGCTTENCLKRTGGNCPFHRVRQSSQGAHLLIVNHALLLADVATGNRVLPDYDYLIVDDHHLEEAVTVPELPGHPVRCGADAAGAG
jgi:DNA polymerase-3 subunit epsilon/ATP-dependent DNA helicase DinG